jgi:hypothetical protein
VKLRADPRSRPFATFFRIYIKASFLLLHYDLILKLRSCSHAKRRMPEKG